MVSAVRKAFRKRQDCGSQWVMCSIHLVYVKKDGATGGTRKKNTKNAGTGASRVHNQKKYELKLPFPIWAPTVNPQISWV